MISFRYHLVTIVAVFLALGLGLLAGTTVLKPILVRSLQKRTNSLEQQNRSLDLQLSQQRGVGDETLPYLVSGRLGGDQVVLVTTDGADPSMVGEAKTAVKLSGGTPIVLDVTSRMAATDADLQDALAKILDAPSTATRQQLQRLAAQRIAQRLAAPPTASGSGGQKDLLEQLFLGGFIKNVSNANPKDLGDSGEIVGVLSGGSTQTVLSPESFSVPLVESLVKQGANVAAAEPTTTFYQFVSLVQDDGAVNSPMVTVDNAEQSIGGAALVLGLDDLVTTGQGGSYGVNEEALIPGFSAP